MMSKQNVPELRFPEFSGEWKEKRWKEVATIKRGASPRPISDPKWFDDTGNIGWLRISDVTKSSIYVRKTSQYLSKEGIEKSVYLENEHLILSIAASVGNPIINKIPLCIHDGFIYFEALTLDMLFSYYYLLRNKKLWGKYGQPGAQVNINSKIVGESTIRRPSINEQMKIGEFFSKLDRLIELEEKKLELLEEQKKGYMQKIFSQELRFKDENGNDYPEWEEKNLEDMGVTYTGLSGKTKENFGVGDAQFITYKNVFDYLFADVRGIQQVEIKEDEKQSSVRKNDILFTTSSETPEEVGMASIWSYETSNTYLNSFCFGYRLEDYEVSAEFLAISLRQEYMRRKITLLGQGSTRFNLSKREVMKLSVFIPCLQEQFKITDLYKKMMYRIDMKKEKINSLKRRKEGLLQNLFI